MKINKKISTFYSLSTLITLGALTSCASLEKIYTPSSNSLAPQAAKQFQEYKKKIKVSRNSKYNAQLRRVGNRIKSVVNMPGAQWEFVVFEDSSPNAFAMPGGKIGVHTGIFSLTKNDAGLAAVIGHELAHVTNNHVGKQRARGISLIGAGLITDIALARSGKSNSTRRAVQGAYQPLASILGVLPYSRNHELESDTVGLQYMAKAGYNPKEALNFWKRFQAYKQKKGSNQPEWLSTHPIDSTRIANIEAHLDAAMALYRQNRR